MLFQRLHQKELSVFTYIIGDDTSLACTVIDPTLDIEPILRVVEARGYHIEAILETHVHADFISGAPALKKALDGKPKIYLSGCGGPEWTAPYADVVLKDGDSVEIGTFRYEAFHTPGHSPEHLCYKIYHDEKLIALLTGDLLFAGSVGRPDLTGDTETASRELYQSLFKKLKTLPEEIAVLPAHGAGSLCAKIISNNPNATLEEEWATNPYLNQRPESEWIEDLLYEMPAAPIAFNRIKEMNRKGTVLPFEADVCLIDTRDPFVFAEGHNPGAINIPWCPAFLVWAAMIAPYAPIKIIPPAKAPFEFVQNILKLIGFYEVESLDLNPKEKLKVIYNDEASPYQLIDVRTAPEVHEKALANSVWIELASLPDQANQLNRTQPFALACASGVRSMIAASWMKANGFKNVVSVKPNV